MKHSGNHPATYVYTPERYTKSATHPGPASLPTALLLDRHAFTQVVHRDIRPKIVLPPLSRVRIVHEITSRFCAQIYAKLKCSD